MPIPIPPHLDLPSKTGGRKVRLRRVFRSRKALRGLTQWVVDRAIPMALLLAALWFFAARYDGGGGEVYRVFTLLDKPVGHPLLWIASAIGWVAVPAIIGGAAGHVITQRIDRVKKQPSNRLFRRRGLKQRLTPPGVIDDLRPYRYGTGSQQAFVDAFVRVAHRNDWQRAQDHWEVYLRDTMSTQQYADLDRHECLRQARNVALIALRVAALSGNGHCIVCDRRS
ncbi:MULTISPECIES: DUF6313 family protein [unclassified Streptomyces]|uniref:DUF6313 family protein n=1 Tax=Streptomyces evansiae TaxID=3075535 RepID=A0ABU2R464_9ACTN|nr:MULTISPECIES: DUF6313 family protein [unclassified Streptomyces]MDT0411489.1 DUF6313 family protein [Streptomyces sp. DSM 41979]SCD91257.1 hypothetical protein GA0115251_128819 [Streptomyces sp. TverLS-915]SCE26272.1 hypothetical protein GA0115252_138212 [Streptomyces sp. DfronAA-171]